MGIPAIFKRLPSLLANSKNISAINFPKRFWILWRLKQMPSPHQMIDCYQQKSNGLRWGTQGKRTYALAALHIKLRGYVWILSHLLCNYGSIVLMRSTQFEVRLVVFLDTKKQYPWTKSCGLDFCPIPTSDPTVVHQKLIHWRFHYITTKHQR